MKNEDGSLPSERFIPIEVTDALKLAWEKRDSSLPSIPLEHQLKLNHLHCAFHYEDEKERLFGIRHADQMMYDVADQLLDTAIVELQEESITAVGLVFRIIQRAMELYGPFRKRILGPVLHHCRSSDEIRTEFNCAARMLSRLKNEYNEALARENKMALVIAEDAASLD